MSLSIDLMEKLHKFSSHHKQLLEKSKSIGCFFCYKTSDISDVDEWVDEDGQCALCPCCGIDSVLPMGPIDLGDNITLIVTKEVLKDMGHYYFSISNATEFLGEE